jgi:hypothetical protein
VLAPIGPRPWPAGPAARNALAGPSHWRGAHVAMAWSPRPGREPRRGNRRRPGRLDGVAVVATEPESLENNIGQGRGGGSSPMRWDGAQAVTQPVRRRRSLNGDGAPVNSRGRL